MLLGLVAFVEALERIGLGGAIVDQSHIDPSIVTYAKPKGVLNLRALESIYVDKNFSTAGLLSRRINEIGL